MKPFLLISLCLLSLFCFSKGSSGGGHASSGSHASSSSHGESAGESAGHESSAGESESHESVSSSREYEPTTITTYYLSPRGVYWTLLLNKHTNKMDTIRAASKTELDNKVNDLSGASATPFIIGFIILMVVIIIFLFWISEGD